MKRLIFLKIDLTRIPNDLNKTKSLVFEKDLIEQAVKDFKKEIKSVKQVKYLKDYLPEPQVLIEFKDEQYQEIYEALCKIELIDIIDSHLPAGE